MALWQVGSDLGFELHVVADKADPAQCVCLGEALRTALADEEGVFEIRAKDRFRNPVYLTETSFEVHSLSPTCVPWGLRVPWVPQVP
jgi:hypothetical protein